VDRPRTYVLLFVSISIVGRVVKGYSRKRSKAPPKRSLDGHPEEWC
jgi:hypothetical protein